MGCGRRHIGCRWVPETGRDLASTPEPGRGDLGSCFSALWDLLYCSSESGGPKLPQNPPWPQQRGRSMWTGVSTDQDHSLFLGLPQVTPVGSCCCWPVCGPP